MLRLLAVFVAVHIAALSVGLLQFADQGCSHDEEHALLHEHAGVPGGAQDAPIATSSDHHDPCPPFCGDCHDCAGCFHPVAVVAATVCAPVRPAEAPTTVHPEFVPAHPPLWDPPSLLHVPRRA